MNMPLPKPTLGDIVELIRQLAGFLEKYRLDLEALKKENGQIKRDIEYLKGRIQAVKYRPTKQEVIKRMERDGLTWEEASEELIQEHHDGA